MSDYKVTDSELTSIANAIRTKGGTSSSLEFPSGFVSAVNAIPTGGGEPVIQPLSVNQNGVYTPSSGVDGYAPVTVNVSGGGDTKSLIYTLNGVDGGRWIDTGYNVSDLANGLYFEQIINEDGDVRMYFALFDLSCIPVLGNYRTIFLFPNGIAFNVAQQNSSFLVSYYNATYSYYNTKIYTFDS